MTTRSFGCAQDDKAAVFLRHFRLCLQPLRMADFPLNHFWDFEYTLL